MVVVKILIGSQLHTEIRLRFGLAHQEFGFLFIAEQIMATINGFVADAHFRHLTERHIAPTNQNIHRIYKIGIDICGGGFVRIALDVRVIENSLIRDIEQGKTIMNPA